MKNISVFGYKPSMDLKLNYSDFLERLSSELTPFSLGIICATISDGTDFLPNNSAQLVNLIRTVVDDYKIEVEEEDVEQFLIGFLKTLEIYGFRYDYTVNWTTLDEDELLSEETTIFKTYKVDGAKDLHICITMFQQEVK